MSAASGVCGGWHRRACRTRRGVGGRTPIGTGQAWTCLTRPRRGRGRSQRPACGRWGSARGSRRSRRASSRRTATSAGSGLLEMIGWSADVGKNAALGLPAAPRLEQSPTLQLVGLRRVDRIGLLIPRDWNDAAMRLVALKRLSLLESSRRGPTFHTGCVSAVVSFCVVAKGGRPRRGRLVRSG
jgi:hypothetical protein